MLSFFYRFLPILIHFSLFFSSRFTDTAMGDDKAKEYKVVIDQEEAENSHYGHNQQTVVAPSGIKLSPTARAILPIASYCFASILMTVTNKYVLSGYEFNMNFLLLTIQVMIIITNNNNNIHKLTFFFFNTELGHSVPISRFQVFQPYQVP